MLVKLSQNTRPLVICRQFATGRSLARAALHPDMRIEPPQVRHGCGSTLTKRWATPTRGGFPGHPRRRLLRDSDE